jgi:hypothetical protein
MKMMLGWGAAWAAQHSSASVTSLIIKRRAGFFKRVQHLFNAGFILKRTK